MAIWRILGLRLTLSGCLINAPPTASSRLAEGPARETAFRLNVETRTFSFDIDRVSVLFEKPTLILMGRQDAHVGYRDGWDILEFYPRATFVVLDRAGHALGVEQEGLFQAIVNEWLDRVEENYLTMEP